MKLKIMTLAGFVTLLVVGFCFTGGLNGGSHPQDGEPFTATVVKSISSFFGGEDGTENAVTEGEGGTGGSIVYEVAAFQHDDLNYSNANLHAAIQPVPAEVPEKMLIMSQNIDFAWTARSFKVDIKDGPLVITYYINEHDDTTIACFMEVKVTDCTTGEVLLEDGYRRKYSADLKKDLTLFYEGPVRIDLYGNLVNADILIYADR